MSRQERERFNSVDRDSLQSSKGDLSLTGFIFPGQGSQYIGMGREFYENYSFVREIFDEASDTLRIDTSKLCFQGPEEILRQTQNTQPLVFIVSFACWQILKRQDISAEIVAGHSLGEYTALVASGALEFLDALRLVQKRGQFMEEASQKYPGTMAAIIGLEEEKIDGLLEEAKAFGIVVAANFNCPQQVVISGEISAVESAVEAAEKAGAKRVVLLNVAGAFHSPLMEEARQKLKDEIEKIQIHPPTIPIVANVSGDYLKEPEAIREALIRQITSPVLWEASIRRMLDSEVNTFVEVGPGRVLSGLLRRISPEGLSLNIEDERSLKKTLENLKKKM